MNKIYKENPQTGEIKEFDDINNIGMTYTNWVTPTQAKIDAYNLLQVKTSAKSILETARKQKQYNSITYNGKNYYSTPNAQFNIFGAQLSLIIHILTEAGLMKPEVLAKFKQQWLDENDQKVILTGVDINSIFTSRFNEIGNLYIQEADKKNIVKDAVNVSQIEAVLQPGTSLQSGSGGGELSQVQNLQPGTGL